MLAPGMRRSVSAALCISVVALGGCVFVQGRFVFHQELTRALAPAPLFVSRFLFDDDGQRALVLLRSHSNSDGRFTQVAGLCDLRSQPPTFQPFPLPLSGRISIALAKSGDGFLSMENGDLYWLARVAPGAVQPIYFGSHPEGRAGFLVCPDDGSMVVVAGVQMTAWDPRAAALLWRRSDHLAASCAFVPRSRRLIGSLETGEIVELDPRTGDRLRLIARHPTPIHWFAISPDGSRLAAVNDGGNCFLTDLESGETIWTRRFKHTTGPQFSSDGQSLLVPTLGADAGIAVVATASGEPVGKLEGGGCVVGLRVRTDGSAYAWNSEGTITAWNLATGKVVFRLDPSASPSFNLPVLPVRLLDTPLPESHALPRAAVAL